MEKWIISEVDTEGKKIYFVNLRPQPNKDGSPLGEIAAGATVEKLGESGDWSQVRVQVKSSTFNGGLTGWISTKLLKHFSEPVEFTVDTDLKAVKSQLTAEKIDDYLKIKDSPLVGIGKFIVEAAERENVNATFIYALAVHESGFGHSEISREKLNLFGWGAVDATPGESAMRFDSYEACIRFVVQRISVLYLTVGGAHFKERPCLGSTSGGYGMNVKYASDPLWAPKVAEHGRTIERWALGWTAPAPVSDLIAAINKVNPSQPYYEPRDITGDRRAETFCNWFAADVLAQVHVFLPLYSEADNAGHYPRPHPIYGSQLKNKPKSADLLNRYFNQGGDDKWHNIDRREAVAEASRGAIVVASVPSVNSRAGHIAVVRPDGHGTVVRIAQAGRRCGANMLLEEGFGALTNIVQFFKYIGS